MTSQPSAPTEPRLRWSSSNDNGVLGNAVQTTREGEHKNQFFFDLDIKRFMPRRPEGMEEFEAQGQDRLIRKKLWEKHGRPMHVVTLEFADAAVEMEFQKDATRRAKRWVLYCVLINVVINFIATFQRFIRVIMNQYVHGTKPVDSRLQAPDNLMWNCCDSFTAMLLFLIQYLQMYKDKDFVLRNFQEVLLFWSLMQACSSLYWADQLKILDDTESAESVSSVIVMTLLAYKGMRFLYFLIFNVVIVGGYFALVARSFEQNHLMVLMSTGLMFLSWTMEVVQRRDFVQASASWRESSRSELLLHNILPASIVSQLKEQKGAISQSYEIATVFFADVVSFTTMSAQVTPDVLVDLLNRMFRRIDHLANNNGVEKIKTIGDCYMAAAGLPIENPMHAQTMARFSLQMCAMMARGDLKNPATGEPIRVRIGIHSGPCVAGVIGHKKFAYDIWGDAVNTASRMESHGDPMKIHCSEDTYKLLQDDFECERREPMTVKGKGLMQTYFVLAEKPSARSKVFLVTDPTANG